MFCAQSAQNFELLMSNDLFSDCEKNEETCFTIKIILSKKLFALFFMWGNFFLNQPIFCQTIKICHKEQKEKSDKIYELEIPSKLHRSIIVWS